MSPTTLSASFPTLFMLALVSLLSVTNSQPAPAAQMDLSTFNLLRMGMTESEVLVRAGLPDLDTSIALESLETESVVTDVADNTRLVGLIRHGRLLAIKELHYIPGPDEHDPHLTVVTIRGGRLFALERVKVFSRNSSSRQSTPSNQRFYSDDEIKIKQAERTVKAAKDYAETRARLKEAILPERQTVSSAVHIYRVVQPDGSVYFGDRPPN